MKFLIKERDVSECLNIGNTSYFGVGSQFSIILINVHLDGDLGVRVFDSFKTDLIHSCIDLGSFSNEQMAVHSHSYISYSVSF